VKVAKKEEKKPEKFDNIAEDQKAFAEQELNIRTLNGDVRH
jgi:hypothetical protein